MTQIPVRNKRKQVMLCVRFDHFRGECLLHQVAKNRRSAEVLLLRASGADRHMHSLELRSEWGLLDLRLAYTVHVPENEEIDSRAGVVIIVFTKRKALENGCIEVMMSDKRLGGYIDFVPVRYKSA